MDESLSATESTTESIGARVASEARPGDVIGLAGELGAGKTVLVRGAVRALGGDPSQVRSPTFTLLNVYPTTPPLYHFDLYRLRSVSDLDAIGFYEFARGAGVSFVEWADRFPELAPEVDRWVRIDFIPGGEGRRIAVSPAANPPRR